MIDTARYFALNAGISFFTPEEFFVERKFTVPTASVAIVQALHAVFRMDETKSHDMETTPPRPTQIVASDAARIGTVPLQLAVGKQEMVVLVGSPSAGKTTFFERYFAPHSYAHINRDTLGSTAKCVHQCRAALKEGLSVVIDNTNPSIATRKLYLDVAKEIGVPVRCFLVRFSVLFTRE